jgi:hypothetical protein
LITLSAERAGNEPSLQYVGYQIFDLPVGADAMNWAGNKERVRFIDTKIGNASIMRVPIRQDFGS